MIAYMSYFSQCDTLKTPTKANAKRLVYKIVIAFIADPIFM